MNDIMSDPLIEASERWIHDFRNKGTGSLFDWNKKKIAEFKNMPLDNLLFDNYFLGLKDKLYDGVYADLVDLWGEKKQRPINLAVFLEGIGAGKSVKSSIILWLLWYELCMYENPQEHFHLVDDSIIAIMLFSRSEKQSRRVVFSYCWERFQSGFNRDYFPVNPRYKTEIRIDRNKTCVYPGTSSALSALGYNVFCISGDQKIRLSNGKDVKVKNLKDKGKVELIGFDIKKGIFKKVKANNIIKTGRKEIFEVVLEDGSVVKCTEDHQFLTYHRKRGEKGGSNSQLIFKYKSLKEITEKDEILSKKDFVKCEECGELFSSITPLHLLNHHFGMRMSLYRRKYPDAIISSELNRERKSRFFKENGASFKGKKHTAEALKKISLANFGRIPNKKTRLKMSRSRIGKLNPMYGRIPSHGKIVEYKGIMMRSSWEKRVAEYLDKLGIRWEYEIETFELEEGMTYTPDFYLPDYVLYIEVKGYFRSARALEKFNKFAKNHSIVLIRKNELKDLSCLESMVALKGEGIYENQIR